AIKNLITLLQRLGKTEDIPYYYRLMAEIEDNAYSPYTRMVYRGLVVANKALCLLGLVFINLATGFLLVLVLQRWLELIAPNRLLSVAVIGIFTFSNLHFAKRALGPLSGHATAGREVCLSTAF
ncbi:MAG: hypothetical protein MUC88_28890, partial [Planctomycetes bacterium]|nr:hypothetical protein [Planctomycetota bacterium]